MVTWSRNIKFSFVREQRGIRAYRWKYIAAIKRVQIFSSTTVHFDSGSIGRDRKKIWYFDTSPWFRTSTPRSVVYAHVGPRRHFSTGLCTVERVEDQFSALRVQRSYTRSNLSRDFLDRIHQRQRTTRVARQRALETLSSRSRACDTFVKALTCQCTRSWKYVIVLETRIRPIIVSSYRTRIVHERTLLDGADST